MNAKLDEAVTEKPIRIFIVDDHPIIRERLGEIISREDDLTVSGEAEHVGDALEAIGREQPDLVLVDLSLKDSYGVELIQTLKQRYPKLPTIVLSMHDETVYAERALRAGARGYVTKQEATRKVIAAIRKVLAGEVYLGEPMAANLVGRLTAGSGNGDDPLRQLTNREMEVFNLIGGGKTVREIAELLYVSPKTVEAHREHIKEKLRLRSSAELLRYAVKTSMHAHMGN